MWTVAKVSDVWVVCMVSTYTYVRKEDRLTKQTAIARAIKLAGTQRVPVLSFDPNLYPMRARSSVRSRNV